jgi:GT2 family glycosyltransferase
MDSASARVAVIIVNWNRRELLRRCLESLQTQLFSHFETVVVDNGSTDGSLELSDDARFRGVRWLRNPVNRGFCCAVNQAVRESQGTYVALLNNDAEADPGWLAALVSALDADPAAGMAASKILAYEDRSVIDKAGHLIYWDGQNRGRGSGERDQGQYDTGVEVAWPDGCAALYRREVFDQIGGFDEDFFAYADDAEFGLRARIAGWGCVYVPAAVVCHRTGSTLGRYSSRRLFLIERNRLWLAAKLFPWRVLWLNPVFFGLRVAASGLAALRGQGELRQATHSLGAAQLLKCLVKANFSALAGLPRMIRKRRQMRALRRLTPGQVTEVIRRFQIPLLDLVTKVR